MSGLKQSMTLADVVALGLSAAIGMSIFSVVAPATALAGPGMLLALAIAILPMVVFVTVYAFMGSAVPRSGSSYAWPAQFVHPYLGFIVSWARLLGNAGTLNLMATVFVAYLSQLIELPRLPTMVALLTIFYLLNLFGAALAGRAAQLLVAIKLVVLVGFVVAGLPNVSLREFEPFLPHGFIGVIAALPLLAGLFMGIESAAEAGEEIRNSKGTMGKGLAISTLIGLLIYAGVTIVTIGTLGATAAGAGNAPLAEAGKSFVGSWMAPAILLTALVSIAAAVNTLMLITARFLFAMGRDRVFPAALARVHPRWGTPYVAITVVYLCGLASLALPDSLIFLFLAANLPTIAKYGANCVAAIRLVDRHPALHAGAALKLRRGTVKIWSWLGILCAAGLFAAGLEADWRPYALLGGWCVLGTAYWFARGRGSSLAMQARG